MGRLILLAAAVLLATLLSGIFSAVNAQSNISCCLTKKGKLKNCELGLTTRKECRNNQTSITLPLAATMRTAMTTQANCNTGERFLDLGLTVYDCYDNLEWEKKTAGNVNDTFTWRRCEPPAPPSFNNCPPVGTAFDYIKQLNTEPCFAGHCDWRLPGVDRGGGAAELETILLPGAPGSCPGQAACIDPIFGPTAAGDYWSSVTSIRDEAYVVDFSNGHVLSDHKDFDEYVRAVRTGP